MQNMTTPRIISVSNEDGPLFAFHHDTPGVTVHDDQITVIDTNDDGNWTIIANGTEHHLDADEWFQDIDWHQTWLHISHWHPDSRSSGRWSDKIGLIVPEVLARYHSHDDEGDELSLHYVENLTDDKMADLVNQFVWSECELCTGERFLAICAEAPPGVGEVPVDITWFAGGDEFSSGYCVDMQLHVPDTVRERLANTPENRWWEPHREEFAAALTELRKRTKPDTDDSNAAAQGASDV